jgi:DNA ligase-1
MKPLLAESVTDLSKLRFPLIASPKLDGIRAVNLGGAIVSRSLKPIPNARVQALFAGDATLGFDGELIFGDPTARDVYHRTSRAVMARDGDPDVTWYLFDHCGEPGAAFVQRLSALQRQAQGMACVRVLDQRRIMNSADLLAYEAECLEQGYEGVMLRDPEGVYKYGRSTEREGILLKLKRFQDDEFKVVGFEERMHNGNEARTNALGHRERSAHRENKSGRGDLGALILETQDGLRFNCGAGFTDDMRREIWTRRDDFLGKWSKVKHFAYGVVDRPRFPVFLGWRSPIDMEGATS